MMEAKQKTVVWGKAGTRSRVKGRARDVVLALWGRESLTSNLSKAETLRNCSSGAH